MTITLWANQINDVEVGKCYKITNASVRTFESKNLSTTTDTLISEIGDIGPVKFKKPELEKETVVSKEVEIESACCHKILLCSICKRSLGIVNEEVDFVKCQNCNMRQLTSKILKSVKTEITAKLPNDQRRRYQILEAARKENECLSSVEDTQDVETFLLKNPKIEVEVDKSDTIIKKIKFLH